MVYRFPLSLLPKVSLDVWDAHREQQVQPQPAAILNQPGTFLARACTNPKLGSKDFLFRMGFRLGMIALTRGKAARQFATMPSLGTNAQESQLPEAAMKVVPKAAAAAGVRKGQRDEPNEPASQGYSGALPVADYLIKGARAMADGSNAARAITQRKNASRFMLPMRQPA